MPVNNREKTKDNKSRLKTYHEITKRLKRFLPHQDLTPAKSLMVDSVSRWEDLRVGRAVQEELSVLAGLYGRLLARDMTIAQENFYTMLLEKAQGRKKIPAMEFYEKIAPSDADQKNHHNLKEG